MFRITASLCILMLAVVTRTTAQADNPAGLLRSAYESWQFDRVIRLADDMLENDSLNPDMLYWKGRALFAMYRNREALSVLKRAEAADSTRVAVCLELLNVCRTLGEKEEAYGAAARMVSLQPDNLFFRFQQAALYNHWEEYRNEIDLLIPLYQADSLRIYTLKQLAGGYAELKMADSALFYYSKALAADSADLSVLHKMVTIRIARKDYQEALRLTESAIRRDSSNPLPIKLNGYIHYLLLEYPVARDQFIRCITLGDTSRFVLKNLGLCYYRQAIYDTAGRLFYRAFQADTSDSESCFYFAVCADRTGDTDQGLEYYNRTLRMILPSSQFLSTIYSEMAGLFNQLGRTDTALVLLQKALETNPGNVLLVFKIAYQYDYHMRQPEDALPWYRDFILKNPDPGSRLFSQPYQISYQEFTTRRIEEIEKAESGKKKP